jgi:hypothetical protein
MVKKTKSKAKTKAVKTAAHTGKRGDSVVGKPRKCSFPGCGRRGHNKRSHENGRLKSDGTIKAR